MQPSVSDFRSYEHSLTGWPVGHTASLEIVVYSQGIQVHQVHVLRHDNKHCCELDKTFQRAKLYMKEGKTLKSPLSYTTAAALFILTCSHALLLNIQLFQVVFILKTSKTFLTSKKRTSTTHQFRPSWFGPSNLFALPELYYELHTYTPGLRDSSINCRLYIRPPHWLHENCSNKMILANFIVNRTILMF
jgi:hypothetical protein